MPPEVFIFVKSGLNDGFTPFEGLSGDEKRPTIRYRECSHLNGECAAGLPVLHPAFQLLSLSSFVCWFRDLHEQERVNLGTCNVCDRVW